MPSPDKPSPDKPSPDKPSPDKPSPDKPSPDKPSPDKPSPDKPSPDMPRIIKPDEEPRNRVLNAPQIAVTRETVTEDGKSQELEFIASASAGTVIDKVSIDGLDVAVSPDGRFSKLLVSGKHDIRVDYSSPSQNIHESVNIPLTVDADKVVKPNNRLGPPTKVPNEGQGVPSAPDPTPAPQPQTSDKNDKKLA